MNATAILGLVFVAIGIACILFPKQIYKHDQRMKRLIKSPEEYRIALIIFGILFCFMGLTAFIFGILGFMK